MTETTKELTTRAKHRVQAVGVYRPEEGGNFLAVIAAAAADPRCSVEKMQALLNMQIQVEDRDALKAFTRDFIALQRKLPVIDKDGKIDHGEGKNDGKARQKSLYSTYPNIMSVCKPLLDEHGFAFNSKSRPEPSGKVFVVSTLRHVEHHSEISEFPLIADPTGSKSPPQQNGSGQQYAMRYNAIALLNIISLAPGDQDKDGYKGNLKRSTDGFVEAVEQPKLSPAQLAELEMVLDGAGISDANFCAHYQIAAPRDLPAALFEAAKKAVRDHAAKKGKT